MSPFRKLVPMGIPVVFFAHAPIEPSFDYLSADNEDGAAKAMEFFFQRGHRRIAHLKGPPDMPVSDYRLEGYKRALMTKGIPYETSLVKEIDFIAASTNIAMENLMKMPIFYFFTVKLIIHWAQAFVINSFYTSTRI